MLGSILAPIFKGLRGFFVILLWGGILIFIDQTYPTLLDGWVWSIALYGMFLVLALTWLYYGTGQHLKPKKDKGGSPYRGDQNGE